MTRAAITVVLVLAIGITIYPQKRSNRNVGDAFGKALLTSIQATLASRAKTRTVLRRGSGSHRAAGDRIFLTFTEGILQVRTPGGLFPVAGGGGSGCFSRDLSERIRQIDSELLRVPRFR